MQSSRDARGELGSACGNREIEFQLQTVPGKAVTTLGPWGVAGSGLCVCFASHADPSPPGASFLTSTESCVYTPQSFPGKPRCAQTGGTSNDPEGMTDSEGSPLLLLLMPRR